MAIKTQGTNLYAIDPTDDSLVTVACVTSISGVTAARDQIEVTCLEANARSYESGMVTPGAVSLGLNFDPTKTSHEFLHDLYVAGTTTKFAIGWSDGTAAPTVDSAGDFVTPTTRTWLVFDAYVSDMPFDFQLSSVVQSTVAMQMSGFPTLTTKST